MLHRNFKIILAALAVSLWYNASSRLYETLIPKKNLTTTLLMFVIGSLVLLYDDCSIAELLFDFKNNHLFSKERTN